MRFVKGLIFGFICCLLLSIWLTGYDHWIDAVQQKWSQFSKHEQAAPEEEADKAPAATPATGTEEHADAAGHTRPDTDEAGDIARFEIGMSVSELHDILGEPDRIDVSAYNYDWHIYNDSLEHYIQFGIRDGQVSSLYTNAPGWSWTEATPGMPVEEWERVWTIDREPSFRLELGYFTFELSDQDLSERPLHIDGEVAVQFYLDIHDDIVSGIRVMDLETLVLHRPYTMRYVGNVPATPEPDEADWEQAETAYERQIFDLVQVTRLTVGLDPLQWHDDVSVVAKAHSEDMLVHDFFDHVSPVTGDLGDRLRRGNIRFAGAGENIAWNYVDAADAHHGWMNSPGHRKNVLDPDFSHLGVGVVEKYYTQNFIRE